MSPDLILLSIMTIGVIILNKEFIKNEFFSKKNY